MSGSRQGRLKKLAEKAGVLDAFQGKRNSQDEQSSKTNGVEPTGAEEEDIIGEEGGGGLESSPAGSVEIPGQLGNEGDGGQHNGTTATTPVAEEVQKMAENKQEHSGHYTCFECKESLSGQRYILRNDNAFCIKCYEMKFANTCHNCTQRVGTDSKDLSYKEKHWHERCFKCSECHTTLVDKLFGSRNEALFCDHCYDEKFGAKCDKCIKVFKAGMKKLEWNNHQWHEECFLCVECNGAIGCNSFMPKADKQYCISCFNKLFAPKCSKDGCGEPIMTGGVLYRNEPYHRDCFGCTECKNNLVGQKFTSRENKPYCAQCFGEKFAKRCNACTQPITGIGGTKFISFDGRHWHNDCFNCNGPACSENLVGKGFITDQQDILCPNCAKLPYTKREEMKQQQAVNAS